MNDNTFKLKDKMKNVEKLYITSKFPPLTDVSGIVFSKRIINSNEKVDVVCSDFDEKKDFDFNKIIDKYIDEKYIIEGKYISNSVDYVNYFRKKGISLLNKSNKKYKTIFSRSWTVESHFLAFEYKLLNPDVKWVAEFSDPLSFDINNQLRVNKPFIADEEYFEKVNNAINKLNKKLFMDKSEDYFPLIKSGDELLFLAEYIPFLFADTVRFTNENQRRVMLKQFGYDIFDFVFNKSEVLRHPTLDSKYYFVKESDYPVDENMLNFAYFGTYLGKRHLEYLFKSFEELDDDIKQKIRIHLFVPDADFIKSNLKYFDMNKYIKIGDKVPFLEFLNLTTKMDVLIVNDLVTEGVFEINPYLPSKLADYLGSGNDIWFICEKGSAMDKFPYKYKSYIDNYELTKQVLLNILIDKLHSTSNIYKKDSNSDNYYQKRLTDLNIILEDMYKQRQYWINKYGSVEKDVNKLYSNANKELNSIKNQLNDKNNEIEVLRNKNNELNNEYENLNKLMKKSSDRVGIKDKIINDKNYELDYYRNHGGLLNRFILNPLSYIYLLFSSSHNEIKLNYHLYKLIRNMHWFNRGYYLSKNKDISKLKWVKIFSPELHYVCYGIHENRRPNRETNYNPSKKDLLKMLLFMKNE